MKNIAAFSLPYMLSYFLQILYGLADLFIVGRYCGVESTTAVSNGAQVMYMFTVVIIGLAMGTTVRIARAVGADDTKRIALIIGNTVTMFMLLAFILSMVLLLFRTGIVHLIDTPQEAAADTESYLTVCFIGIPFIVAYNIIASIFRGLGDSKSPMCLVAVACCVNIALDYLFIGHYEMGAMGAALGTTLSQMTSVIFALLVIRRHKTETSVSRHDFRLRRNVVNGILKLGVPVALQDGFIQVAFIAITVIANGRGVTDAAAVGIVEKVIGLLFIVPSAMSATVSAVCAQNIGAGKILRARTTLKYAVCISVCFGAVVATAVQFIPCPTVGLFTDDIEVVVSGGEYLRSYIWDCILAGIHFCFSGFFTACGYSVISFGHNFLSIICARIPLSLLASQTYSDTLYPMGLACPAGSLFSVAICIAVYSYMKNRDRFAAQN